MKNDTNENFDQNSLLRPTLLPHDVLFGAANLRVKPLELSLSSTLSSFRVIPTAPKYITGVRYVELSPLKIRGLNSSIVKNFVLRVKPQLLKDVNELRKMPRIAKLKLIPKKFSFESRFAQYVLYRPTYILSNCIY
jgi:hypothetical protein